MRVGLVLGAGGGWWDTPITPGVLAALERDLGWDARDAEVIVGTSAGALTGALLRVGVGPEDLAAWNVDAPLTEAADTSTASGFPPAVAAVLPHDAAASSAPARTLVPLAVVSPPLATSPLGLFPCAPPRRDSRLGDARSGLNDIARAWPDRPLWINAVRRRNLRRVVFGRDLDATLSDAVTASCAVPGFFEPARIGAEHAQDSHQKHLPQTRREQSRGRARARELELL
jgi:NTE family protein